MDIVERIRNRIHDAPMETERMLDEAADIIEALRRDFDVLSKRVFASRDTSRCTGL